ncbi:MAG: gliding motility-associated C-terminal domain-containing protein, partial [Bacteroidia bacterium]|nr:gliding motility-associated C-terminal domain-containing protein [Bacteroidia bacterium]
VLQVVSNIHSCKDSIVKDITIKPSWVVYVPNAFTPNQDGLNDGFRALGIGIEAFKMQIFDRWGKMIFETNDINTPWDGSVGRGNSGDAKQEVYVWKVKVKDVNHHDHDLIGHVTLLK